MYNVNQNELDILAYWKEHMCFEKSVEMRPENKPYVFYDGPPFATGLPHYGHIVTSLMKDVVPRYWTMQGYRVERRWGWDCHGLPIENIIEKELQLEDRRALEAYGVGKFNEACRATVLKYADDWKNIIPRMGRWVDMDHDYKTMDPSFMESVWWVFAELYKKGLIYEGKKAMHVCPRCVTPLSNFEVTLGYKDVKDISAYVKFKIIHHKSKIINLIGVDEPMYMVAWTTTPWTLPGNVLLAVNPDVEYMVSRYAHGDTSSVIIFAKDRAEQVMKDTVHEILGVVKGQDLVGLAYEPLLPYFANTSNAFRVVAGDFVTTDEGSGIVHIAPGYGEDDYQLGQKEGVATVQHVGMDGRFTVEVGDGLAGTEVKTKEEPNKGDIAMLKLLTTEGRLLKKESLVHSYPHCWRCDTPLLNYAASSWFVRVTDLKEDLVANNVKIHWVPDNVKEGRFGKWLEGARDWAISRNRFWGTPLPVWRCEKNHESIAKSQKNCPDIVIGSVGELEKLSGQTVGDLHKHVIDPMTFPCPQCGEVMRRIPEVLDCWFESGSMPYGQMHYPFEHKDTLEKGFPAEFIAEGQDQTRGWFYTLHVLATALTRGATPSIAKGMKTPAFKNVIVNGIVLAEDGKKMSKKLKNYPDPLVILEKYGADALRFYLVSSPVMYGESLNFSEAGVREMFNKVVNTLWNVCSFYQLFATDDTATTLGSDHILDRWILSKLYVLLKEVDARMREYKLAEASRPIVDFIDDLSTWYLRRSRDRLKGDDVKDKQTALSTLRHILLVLVKIMAPFTPFIAEAIYLELKKMGSHAAGDVYEVSVHLEDWPVLYDALIDESVIAEMVVARKAVELGLSIRAEKGIKVRQVLGALSIVNGQLSGELKRVIADELNVKEIVEGKVEGEHWIIKEDGNMTVALNMEITEALKKEGLMREIVRTINQERKELGLTVTDRVVVEYATNDLLLGQVFTDCATEITRQVLASDLRVGAGKEVQIDGRTVYLGISKV